MKTYTRNSKFTELNKYCHLAEKNSFVEVCEWNNGEGIDVSINDKHFQLTYGELECIYILALFKE